MEAYEAPEITEVGTIEELTQGDSIGGFLDFDYPDNTPFSELTFSGPL